ncbi:MAG TPA: Ig-like domain-containing protein, partial [Verrucomicrobiae bacterium]|nr:Ig-like domain-containing protein [Verrucomicrobiae bacterium]
MNPTQRLPLSLAVVTLLLLTAGSAHAQILTVTNGLQLWLKADAGVTTNAGGAVTTWADQSPNANNAVQTDDTAAPLWVANAQNNKPALRFDGANDQLDVAHAPSLAIAGDISSFFVVKFDDFATYRAVWAKTVVNLPAPTDYYALPGTGIPRAYRGDGTMTSLGSVDGTRLRAATYLVVGFEMAGTTLTHYLNGQPSGSGEITATLADGGTALRIGTRDDLFTRMKGDIAELLIYDVALSDTDRNSVVSYLQTKYNIVNLPPTVTLTSTPGPAVTDADVITLNAVATDPDGTIARVDFFANGQLIGAAMASPYSMRVGIATAGTVSFTAVATDNKDGTGASAPVTLTASPLSVVLAPPTNGRQLWLRADAGITTNASGAVTAWNDQSGNANNASQSLDENFAPALVNDAANGQPVLRFDGVDDFLEVPSSPSIAITGDIASFFVVKFDDFATFRAVWGKTDINQPRPTDYYVLPGSGVPRAFRGGDAGNDSVDGAGRLATNAYLVVGFNQAGNAFSHHLNGAPFGAGSMDAVPTDAGKPLKIGTRDDFATQMKGDIGELLIYDAALTSADLKSLSSYLGAKYGVPIVVPTNSAPNVAINTPTNGAAFVAPTNTTITATATDADGSVVRVDFYIGGGLAASDTNAPYSATIDLPAAGNFSLTAVATDNLGVASTSAPVAITVSSTQPVPLPSPARLKLWLRADAGVTTNLAGAVTAWSDQSGNFNNAQQSDETAAPLWIANAVTNKPALRFDGNNDYLSVASSPSIAITGDLSTFFVVRFDDFASFRAVWAKTENNLPRPTDYYVAPDSGIPNVLRGGTAGLGNVNAAAALPANQYIIAGFDMEGTTARHYIDGQENGFGDITATITDSGTPLLVGTRGDLFTKMKGDIAEIIIYDLALSGTDRNAVFSYLAAKYAINIGTSAPALSATRAGNDITISWPASATGFELESSDVLSATTCTTVPFTPPQPGQDPSV